MPFMPFLLYLDSNFVIEIFGVFNPPFSGLINHQVYVHQIITILFDHHDQETSQFSH